MSKPKYRPVTQPLPCHKGKFKFPVRNTACLKIKLVNLTSDTFEKLGKVKKIATLLVYSEDLNNKHLKKGNI